MSGSIIVGKIKNIQSGSLDWVVLDETDLSEYIAWFTEEMVSREPDDAADWIDFTWRAEMFLAAITKRRVTPFEEKEIE
jgi:hypothetical protein